jgi:hypothetical protein
LRGHITHPYGFNLFGVEFSTIVTNFPGDWRNYARGSTTSRCLERILMSRAFQICDNFATYKKRRTARIDRNGSNITKLYTLRNVLH